MNHPLHKNDETEKLHAVMMGETVDIPNGLWIAWKDGELEYLAERDERYPQVHPNVYAPASLSTSVKLLKGGGSGAAVFFGHHPTFQNIVMKHGSAKDTMEVLSLAWIEKELLERGGSKHQLQSRIPTLVGVYISPYHVRDRAKELWEELQHNRKMVLRRLFTLSNHDDDEESQLIRIVEQMKDHSRQKRAITVLQTNNGVDLEVKEDEIVLHLPQTHTKQNGYETLQRLAQILSTKQEYYHWKVTLAQKEIGGSYTENGATVLTSGQLRGTLLETLQLEITDVVRELQGLTYPEEREGLQQVNEELRHLQQSNDPASISTSTDSYVGFAIRKNFHPKKGRLVHLRDFGRYFRNHFKLQECEKEPARLLGLVLERNADLPNIFVDSRATRSALDHMESCWLELLEEAVSLADNTTAKDCIWTCGLTDAGLHNTFLCEEKGLELFDLGTPQLISQPAFLTKFFMSFFHAPGMEEAESGIWVHRFTIKKNRAILTPRTREMIPYLYDCFESTLDHVVQNLFAGDVRVRDLILKYVVLQLLSDAAFCLGRWEQKGGGKDRYGYSASDDLSKWLYRTLWDLYIASDVYETLIASREK